MWRTRPLINNYNNAKLTGRNAMPQKDETSEGGSNFATDRITYWKTLGNPASIPSPITNTTHMVNDINGRPRLAQNGANIAQKKWGNSNRDASQIARNRHIVSVGKGSMNPDANSSISFTTVRSVNTEQDARRRCRSGGYCVPPKVSQKYLLRPTFSGVEYRIVAAGYQARLSYPRAGLYQYNSQYPPTNTEYPYGQLLHSGTISYNLAIIALDGTFISCDTYNIFSNSNGDANAEAMAAAINALDGNQYVVIFTYDEPKTHAVTNSNFVAALKACGASSTFETMIQYRSAYILIGAYGLGEGNGIEHYKGDNFGFNGDPEAKLNVLLPFN